MVITIRPTQPTDLAPLTELYNHYILTTTTTFDIEPYSLEQRQDQWFCHYGLEGRYRLLVAAQDQTPVGYITSSQLRAKAAYDTSVETSIYIHPDAQGQGLGTQLYTSLFTALSTEDVHRAYAAITLPNRASIALHQKLGFSRVGLHREVGRKFGRYWDVEWFEKDL